MKFGVLALDYDGTIARDGVLDPDVRTSLVELRARGIRVILVTGRILSDLERVAGDLKFADAVVAESGAVIAFPNGHSWVVGEPPPAEFLDELRHRSISFTEGQCIVETDATLAPQLLSVIRERELPLALLFNRGRLMVLPQAVSKSTVSVSCSRPCASRFTTPWQLAMPRMTMTSWQLANWVLQ